MKKLIHHRFGPVATVCFFVITLSFLTRITLLILSWKQIDLNVFSLLGVFFIGFFYDLVVASFFSIPVALYCWLMKDSWYRSKANRIPLFFMLAIILVILLINAGAEIVFWNEFNVRYNFIAVDYLVYTNEVIGNIRESYNLPFILSVVIVSAIILLIASRKMIISSQKVSMRFVKRSAFFFFFLLFPVAGYFLVNNRIKNFTDNNYVNELSGTGIYEFGSAFWNNEIDYRKFYAIGSDHENLQIVKRMLASPYTHFLQNDSGILRTININTTYQPSNIILISVESLSAEFMAHFGNKAGITPHLDSLIPHSLFFENFYATGTRTVRGLEALSLAIPPTPGQSIIRRPHNENMFTMGAVLKEKGYDVGFIYGGNSFFDNMGYFFSHSGYKVTDKRDIPQSRIHHETVWGVADEDAFSIAIDECDKSFRAGKNFFNHIMTVSNHRPYTYPEGRIDISPTTKTRDGAVKYTDHAINEFIKSAQSKPWFQNTIFVVVADHCASSAGKTDLPVNRYHIPCLVYAPSLIKPQIVTRKTSQIDLAPTLLGLMHTPYQSKFMGYDLFAVQNANDRIFISTYQDLGYYKNDTLVILSPKKKIQAFKIDQPSGNATRIPLTKPIISEAIAWYQTASWLFDSGAYTFHRHSE